MSPSTLSRAFITLWAYSTVITGGIWSTPTVVDVVEMGGATVEVGEASADDLPLEQAPAASVAIAITTASARRLRITDLGSSPSVASPVRNARKSIEAAS